MLFFLLVYNAIVAVTATNLTVLRADYMERENKENLLVID